MGGGSRWVEDWILLRGVDVRQSQAVIETNVCYRILVEKLLCSELIKDGVGAVLKPFTIVGCDSNNMGG